MIVVAGEALVDLAPRDDLLVPLPGGAPYNVALGLGRLGHATAFLGRLSSDGFGRRLADHLAAEGVDLGLAVTTDDPTTLAVVHLDADGRASYGFYLAGTSAAGLSTADLPELPAGAALHVSLGAVSLDTVPAGAALEALIASARDRHLVMLDPNVRPGAIIDLADYTDRLGRLVSTIDLVKVSDEDLATLEPGSDPLALARTWAGTGTPLVVVTRGPDGAVAMRADRPDVAVAGEPVEVVDTVGAGDAFTAGLLAWLDAGPGLSREAVRALTDDEVAVALRHAVHVAALTCTRAGADPPRLTDL